MKETFLQRAFRRSTAHIRVLAVLLFIAVSVTGFMFYVAVASPGVSKAFSGNGAGTADDPYQISTCQQLQDIQLETSASYVLVDDIDCTETINWNQDAGFIPINFSGSLDGRNFSIIGLHIQRPLDYAAGLFSNTTGAQFIKNIKLINSPQTQGQVAILGRQVVGALAAEVGQNVVISNIHSELNVKSIPDTNSVTGGLVGINRGQITRSSSSGNVEVVGGTGIYASVGGLVGVMDNYELSIRYIHDSYATGNVTVTNISSIGGEKCGGLLGNIDPGTSLKWSYSTGTVTCGFDNGQSDGGLIGRIQTDGVDDPVIAYNFTKSPVNPTVSSISSGFAGYTPSPSVDLTSNYYDATSTGKTTCVANQPNGCNAVNTDGNDSNYFINNANPPLPNYDQNIIWDINGALPTHKTYSVSSNAPTNVSVVRNGSNFDMTWDTPIVNEGRSVGITDYLIFYKDHNTNTWTQYIDDVSTNTNVTMSGLNIPGNYDFRVRAVNDAGNGLYSTLLNFATGIPETAPQNVTVTPNVYSAVVNWETVNDATAYEVQVRRAGDTEWTTSQADGAITTSYKVYTLAPQVNFEIRVRAVNSAGNGPWSQTVTSTTINPQLHNISNCQQLQDISNDMEGIYVLTADIDCSSVPNFSVIGGTSEPFVGSLDGKGFKISNVTIQKDASSNNNLFNGVGLFGVVVGAKLQNITIENSTIVGNFTYDANSTPTVNNYLDYKSIYTAFLDSGYSTLASIPRFAVGGVAGVLVGNGSVSNIKVLNTTVQGSVSGSVFGAVMPMLNIDDIYPLIQSIAGPGQNPDPQSLIANFNQTLVLDGLQSSGTVNGLISGGLVGIGLSPVGSLVGADGEFRIQNSSSSSSVEATVGGGLIGSGISLSIGSIPLTLADGLSASNATLLSTMSDAVNRTLSTRSVSIINSSASGSVSSCNAVTNARNGVLGGLIGLGLGVKVQGSHASGAVSTCSGSTEQRMFYGGLMGGLSGAMVASQIDNSYATGGVSAIRNGGSNSYESSIYMGVAGGLTGLTIDGADDSGGTYAVNNSYATGDINIQGKNGLISVSGGLVGLQLGSGTIAGSHSSGSLTSSTAQENVGALTISGGITGMTIGADVLFHTQTYLSNLYSTPNIYQPTHGAIITNSYSTGAVNSVKDGKSGLLALTGGVTGLFIGSGTINGSHASGAIRSDIVDKLDLKNGSNYQNAATNTNFGAAISGGLVGSAYGIDLVAVNSSVLAGYGARSIDQLQSSQGFVVNDSYATGEVKANVAGGLIGSAEFNTKINKAYSEGSVRGEIAGGLIGQSGILSVASPIGFTYFANMVRGWVQNEGNLTQ